MRLREKIKANIVKYGAGRLALTSVAAILLSLVLTLVELTDDVMEGDTQAFDEWALRLMRTHENVDVPIGPAWVQQAAVDVTALGSNTVLLFVAVTAMVFAVMVGRRDILGFLFLSSAGALALNLGLKLVFARERPDIAPHLTHVSTYSYPSGHALMSAAIYLSFAAIIAALAHGHLPRIFILAIAFLIAGAVGISRVYLGVHYPTDVVAGWMIGTAWALVCWIGVLVKTGRLSWRT